MAPRKCFFGCEGKSTLFSFSKELSVRQKWIEFLFPGQQKKSHVSVSSVCVCSRHFTQDCFVNIGQFEAGLAAKLLLKDGAVPTILGRVEESEAHASTSQQIPILAPPRHMGCQTDPASAVSRETQICPHMVSVGTKMTLCPSTKSVATQLSYGTLRQHVRSKGTQTTVPSVRPAKRPRLELLEDEDEEQEEETIFPHPHNFTYKPGDSMTNPFETRWNESTTDYSDTKYIVFESCLKELFQTCPVCKWECAVQRRRLGTYVDFTQLCPNCQYTRKWQSQPLRENTPVGNLQMSAAVYFTGGSFAQVDKIFKAMNVQMVKYNTFKRHARNLLEPAINHKWKNDQQVLFQHLRQRSDIAVGGDMKADAPGHGAKFSSYTLMHLDSANVIDIQLVQSSEVGGSLHIEKEGLKRGLDHLEENNVNVKYIVTKRRTQVQTFLRERGVTQCYDVCHLEKALSKKLRALAKNKDCAVLRKWLPAIQNHMYWTAMSSKSGQEKVAKWKSIINHIQDVHTHNDPLYPKCLHADKVSRDPSKWFQPCTKPLYKVRRILVNPRVLRDVEKLSEDHQTSSLESFHSVILRFAPKDVVHTYIGKLCSALWRKICTAEYGKAKKLKPLRCMDDLKLKMAALKIRDQAAGCWKELYFRSLAAFRTKQKRNLGLISSHTGLPSRTENVLRNLGVTWELTVFDKSGCESTHKLSWSRFCETCVTLCWSGGGCLPNYQQISSLQLYGVKRIALNNPGLKKSLMSRLDMQSLTKNMQIIGRDRLVELKLLQPGVVIGVWRDHSSVAFVMITLHFHGLVERSIDGSPVCPYVEPMVKPPFDDVDPEYGLHGYQLHIVLHNTACEIMCRSFSQLFCRRTQICDGLIQLTAISRTDLSQHTPLSGSITLPWRCEALQGTVQNCCIMSVTLLDESKKPFWCVCSPVSMTPEEKTSVSYDYDSDHFLIHYQDPDGQVKMTLAWMKEQKQFFLISLVVCLTVCKVNRHFSRAY